MRLNRLKIIFFPVLIAGCADFPEAPNPSRSAQTAPYPQLVPVETLRAAAPEPRADEDTADRLEARAARLRARAARLRGTVLTPTEKAGLRREIARADDPA